MTQLGFCLRCAIDRPVKHRITTLSQANNKHAHTSFRVNVIQSILFQMFKALLGNCLALYYILKAFGIH